MANVPKPEDTELPVAAAEAKKAEQGTAARRVDDRELVRRAQHGEKEAFELLVAKHQGRVFAVAGGILRNREDVEDIAQQVFLKAYFSLKRFDQRSAFSTWLYKITVNECWDLLRKKKVRPLVFESELSEEQAHAYQSTEQKAEFAPDISEQLDTKQQLDHWLECLEERDRTMLVLKEVQGFTVEEIAEIMGINGNTVKVRLFRARQKIAEKIRRKKRAAGV
ncbi:MAG TPA: sigma-70 family RNA polymerase sigma factor [Candidatus Acidoferrales bacterium]|jgi:RNA polymerase sigma-70 factor (ECF subfamily)|nr:sigma-70 family RNA polymerase sigma factor [Candidatus Acidoferrales bacterium]